MGIPGGLCGLEDRGGNRGKVRRGPLDRPVRFAAAHDVEPPIVTPRETLGAQDRGGAERDRHIEAMTHLQARKPGAGDAEDRKRMGIEGDRFSDCGGVASIFTLPESVAQDHAWGPAARLVVGGSEKCSESGNHSQHVEKITAHPKHVGGAHLASRGEIGSVTAKGEEAREGLLVFANLLPKRIRAVSLRACGNSRRIILIGDPDPSQFVWLADRQCSQTDGVEELEDRRVCADAKGQREDRHDREARIQPQEADAMAEVLYNGVKHAEGIHAVDLLADQYWIAEFAAGCMAGLAGRQATGNVFESFGVEICFQFAGALFIPTLAVEVAAPAHVSILGWAENAADGLYQLVPPAGLLVELFLARRRQTVVAGFAVVFRGPPKGRDPAAIFETVQGGKEGPVLYLQNIFRSAFNGVGDRVAMRRSRHQRP